LTYSFCLQNLQTGLEVRDRQAAFIGNSSKLDDDYTGRTTYDQVMRVLFSQPLHAIDLADIGFWGGGDVSDYTARRIIELPSFRYLKDRH